MFNKQSSSCALSYCFLYLLPIFLVFLGGCVPSGDSSSEKALKISPHYNKSAPLLSLFLLSDENKGAGVSVMIDSIELFDGLQWLSATDNSFQYNSAQKKSDQVFINRFEVHEGEYSKVRITVLKAEIIDDEGAHPLELVKNSVTIDLGLPLQLMQHDRKCLFVVLDRQASLSPSKQGFTPVFRAYSQEVTLTSELAYVSCPDIDSVFIVRTDTNRVVGAWAVTGKPTYLQVFKDDDEIYILAEKEHLIKVYELSSGRLKDTITIPLIVKPGLMVINSAKTNAYLLDRATDFAYRIDLTAKSYATRVRIGEKPTYLVYLEDQERLAVSSELSQKVYLLDPTSLLTIDTISSGSGPSGMFPYGGKLYIAETTANSVMVYDFTSGKIVRNSVGIGPVRLIEYNDHIFVANKRSGTVSVLLPSQLSTLKEIRIGGAPDEMALSNNRLWLYVVDSGKNRLSVIDLTTHRLNTTVELGTAPFDVEIIN